MIKECNLQDKIILTGKLGEEEINEELLKSEIFILTSKNESFSLVLCEAMNYGLPCVAFDVEVGPREIIDDGVTGFLIKDRNIDLMIEKISNLLEDEVLRNNMGKNSSDCIKKFYSNNIIKKWEKIFNKTDWLWNILVIQ